MRLVYISSDTLSTCRCFKFAVSVTRLDEDWESLRELDVPIDHGKGNETLYIYILIQYTLQHATVCMYYKDNDS